MISLRVGAPRSQSSIPLIKASATKPKTGLRGFRGSTEEPPVTSPTRYSYSSGDDPTPLPCVQGFSAEKAALGSKATLLKGGSEETREKEY